MINHNAWRCGNASQCCVWAWVCECMLPVLYVFKGAHGRRDAAAGVDSQCFPKAAEDWDTPARKSQSEGKLLIDDVSNMCDTELQCDNVTHKHWPAGTLTQRQQLSSLQLQTGKLPYGHLGELHVIDCRLRTHTHARTHTLTHTHTHTHS